MELKILRTLMLFFPYFLSLDLLADAANSTSINDKIDQVVELAIKEFNIPSVSLSIVKEEKLFYKQAYGYAQLEPKVLAKAHMPYRIASISKQFLAVSILLLAEEGKLKLDDPISKYLKNVNQKYVITIRQLLSHTSGLQDYFPQDYTPPYMLQAIEPKEILTKWGTKSLDFTPGEQFQYSNLGYIAAGLIIEKVTKRPLSEFFHKRIFKPLEMNSAIDASDAKQINPLHELVKGYFVYALGPHHREQYEGFGWLFGAGGLSMTAEDLSKWNIAILQEKLMSRKSYAEFEKEVLLSNGMGTNYGLGVGLDKVKGQRVLRHSGEASGFTSQNIVFPESGMSVSIFVNQAATSASRIIADRICDILLESISLENINDVQKMIESLQKGQIDRSKLTENANFYFSSQAIEDYKNSLALLGSIKTVNQISSSLRGGMKSRILKVSFDSKIITVMLIEKFDGMIEQFIVH